MLGSVLKHFRDITVFNVSFLVIIYENKFN